MTIQSYNQQWKSRLSINFKNQNQEFNQARSLIGSDSSGLSDPFARYFFEIECLLTFIEYLQKFFDIYFNSPWAIDHYIFLLMCFFEGYFHLISLSLILREKCPYMISLSLFLCLWEFHFHFVICWSAFFVFPSLPFCDNCLCRVSVGEYCLGTQVIDRLNVIVHNQPEWLRSLINQASAVSSSSSTLVSTINHHDHHQYHQPSKQRYSFNQQFNSTSLPSFALSWRQNQIRSTSVWKCSISQQFLFT